METGDIVKHCATVLKKIKSEEVSENDLGKEFLQLGLQLAEIESCEPISEVAKRYAYLLSPLYRAESCEWSELVNEIKELREDLCWVSINVDINHFFKCQTHFIMGLNHLQFTLTTTEYENLTAIEAHTLVNYIYKCIEKIRCNMENWE